jgi:D-beta-D-heptose 7-phosphate kinase/D-beta-D-heptose 1-phosphate adenosyltransferase
MNILVIGDILLDVNHNCVTTRNAPEANIPVYNTLNTDYILGGAANVAKNIKSLNKNVTFVSVVGDDESGYRLKNMLESMHINNNMYIDTSRKTTCKTRIIHNNNIAARYDIEDTHFIDESIENMIVEYIKSKPEIKTIVFSDYGKGLLTENICKKLIKYAKDNSILTFVDPKPENSTKYKNCFCFKLNLNEGQLITGKTEPREIIKKLKDEIQCKHVILTCGSDGMYIDDVEHHIRHKSKIQTVDVTGSGDIVMALLTHLYLSTSDIYKSCKIANYIAGKGTAVVGNYTLSQKDIDEYVDNIIYDNESEKIKNIRTMHNNIVFTNGCFDIIHSAHIRLLTFSKKMGDILVIGLNSDESIKRLKGDSRPINNTVERYDLLMSLGIVDYIIIFNDDTPSKILHSLRPNVIVKGGDYTKETVIGNEYADETVIYDYKHGLSTTNTIHKIGNANKMT